MNQKIKIQKFQNITEAWYRVLKMQNIMKWTDFGGQVCTIPTLLMAGNSENIKFGT